MSDPIPPPPCGGQKRIAVIGAGATGALTAFELVRAGHQVTLIDKGAPGNGSSGRSAACIRQQFSTTSTVRGMVYSTSYYDNWPEYMGGQDPPIRHGGYLFLYDWTTNKSTIKDRVKMQREAGLNDVELLDPEQVYNKFPYIDTRGLNCGTWCPSDGFLQHDRVYQDAVNMIKRLGSTVNSKCEVTGAVLDREGGICLVKTSSGSFEVDVVVNATNAWASIVSIMLGGGTLPISPRKRYLYFAPGPVTQTDYITVEQFGSLPMVIIPNNAYCRPTLDGQLLFARLHATNPMKEDELDDQDTIEPGFRGKGIHDYGPGVLKNIANWLPFADELGPHRSVTAGLYADTPDLNPIIGYDPRVRNLIHAVGFSGHGLMHAPFSARIVGELIDKGRDLEHIVLPGMKPVRVDVYHVDREFRSPEGQVI